MQMPMQMHAPITMPIQLSAPVSVPVRMARETLASTLLPMQSLLQLPPNVAFIEPTIYSINIPYHLHVLIFGPNWMYAKDMKQKYNVEIQSSNSRGHTDLVYVMGAYEVIIPFINHLNELAHILSSSIFSMAMAIETKHYARITGTRGANLNKLMIRHWVNVIIPEKDEKQVKEVVIWGLKAHCLGACEDIIQQINDPNHTGIEDEPFNSQYPSEFQPLPKSKVSLEVSLSNENAAIVKRNRNDIVWVLRQKYGVRMTITKNDAIVLKGPASECREVQNCLEGMFQIEQEVLVPRELRRFVFGKGGHGTRKMSLEYNVIINIPSKNDDSNTVTVYSSHQENIARVCQVIESRKESYQLNYSTQ